LAAVLAIIIDLARRTRRDGLHWLGAALVMLSCVQSLVWWVASKFL
jgi:hypothetical protein